MTKAHEEKNTMIEDVNVPAHADRTTTALFEHTKKALVKCAGARCWVCGRTAEESGHPLEAHHHPIERSLTEMIDWERVKPDFPYFDWANFDPVNDPYKFVDDMTVNGLLLCKDHHTGTDEGIHRLTYPLWIAQRYGKVGYRFSDIEILEHEG